MTTGQYPNSCIRRFAQRLNLMASTGINKNKREHLIKLAYKMKQPMKNRMKTIYESADLGQVRLQNSYLIPATPSTTKSSLVNVPVLSKQQTSTLPAKGIRKGSVQNRPIDERIETRLEYEKNNLFIGVLVKLYISED